MGETTPCIAVSNLQQWPCWAKDQTFLVDFLKNWWISQFSRRLGFISCFTSRLGGFAAAFWSFYGPPPINPSFASVWTHGWLMFRLKLQKIILIGEVHFSFSCRGFTRLRFSEFFGFSMADFWQKFWAFCREFSRCRDYALICRKCCDYAFFCRECRDYALFGVQFYSEFWQKSFKNIDIIFDSLDITFKTKFSHRH